MHSHWMFRLKSKVLLEPALVGRERELEELRSHLNSVIKGKGKTVFVSGEAGSGKTRLVKEFLAIARTQGVPWLAGWCLGNAGVPYFPFIEAFNSYFSPCTEEKHIPRCLKPQLNPRLLVKRCKAQIKGWKQQTG